LRDDSLVIASGKHGVDVGFQGAINNKPPFLSEIFYDELSGKVFEDIRMMTTYLYPC
jgi:hypothetical protein